MTSEEMSAFRQKLKDLMDIAPGADKARKIIADFILAKSEDEIAKLFDVVAGYVPLAKILGF